MKELPVPLVFHKARQEHGIGGLIHRRSFESLDQHISIVFKISYSSHLELRIFLNMPKGFAVEARSIDPPDKRSKSLLPLSKLGSFEYFISNNRNLPPGLSTRANSDTACSCSSSGRTQHRKND